jgi:hypothetical protein
MAFAAAAGKWVANSREVSQFMHDYFRRPVAHHPLCLASQWPGSWDGALIDHGGARWALLVSQPLSKHRRDGTASAGACRTKSCFIQTWLRDESVSLGGIEVPRWPERRAEVNSAFHCLGFGDLVPNDGWLRFCASHRQTRLGSGVMEEDSCVFGRSSKLWFGKLQVSLFAGQRAASHCVA